MLGGGGRIKVTPTEWHLQKPWMSETADSSNQVISQRNINSSQVQMSSLSFYQRWKGWGGSVEDDSSLQSWHLGSEAGGSGGPAYVCVVSGGTPMKSPLGERGRWGGGAIKRSLLEDMNPAMADPLFRVLHKKKKWNNLSSERKSMPPDHFPLLFKQQALWRGKSWFWNVLACCAG